MSKFRQIVGTGAGTGVLKSFRVCFAEGAVSSCRTGLLFDIASAGRALAFWFGDALGAFATTICSTNNITMTEKGILDRLGLLLPAKKEKKELRRGACICFLW